MSNVRAPDRQLMLTAKHPLRRLLAGAGSVASACVLYAGAVAYPDAGARLEVAAACTAVLGFGFLVAALLGYVNNALISFVSRHPALTHRLHLATVVVLLLLLAAYVLSLSLGALWSGNAPVISRHAGSVLKADDVTYFYASVAFHFVVGLVLLYGAWFLLRNSRREP